ncbi:MAG: hypothetical protein JW874_04300 [Spirochaetales bacterium]|nr:hypothetical protein [Spirochaetales bacterium]
MKIKRLWCIIFAFALALSCKSPDTDPDPEPDVIEVLNDLGVNTDLGSRQDPNENDLPESYNPLGPQVGVFFKQCEIFLTGPTNNSQHIALWGDEEEGYTQLATDTDSGWYSRAKSSMEGDYDGDGLDEVAIAVAYPATSKVGIRIFNYKDGSVVAAEEVTSISISSLDTILSGGAGSSDSNADGYLRMDTASGDLDGDGCAELLLVVGDTLYIMDDYSESFELVYSQSFSLSATEKTYVRVDCADFNVDGRDEIVVAAGVGIQTGIGEYYIYEYNDEALSALDSDELLTTSASSTYALIAADVACGDFDGDGLPETAFAGRQHNDTHFDVFILDTEMNDDSEPVFSFLGSIAQDNYNYGPQCWLAGVDAGDIDGDGDDDIAAYKDIYIMENGGIAYHSLYGNDAIRPSADPDHNYPAFDLIRVGDVTCDKKEDVVFITADGDQMYAFYVDEDTNVFSEGEIGPYGESPYPTICLPNVDDDSAVVRYLEHELLFTDPVIVAVLASPPYWTDVNEEGDGGTGFGSIEGHAGEESSSHGFHVGFSIGTEFSAPFGLGGASFKTTVDNSFNWGTASTHEVTETWGYSTGVGEDKVIFTAVPFDVYYYEILSSPDESQIGATITINVPRPPGKYHQSVTFFNEHNSDGYDITSTSLMHTLGNPFSYADEDERDVLEDASGDRGLFSSHNLQVGTSNSGTSVITLEDLVSETANFDYELSVDVEAEVTGASITAGVNAGYCYGYSYSTTVTTGTYIEGEVPDIPPDDYESSMQFRWGLMAYPKEDLDQSFTIVTYWVDL